MLLIGKNWRALAYAIIIGLGVVFTQQLDMTESSATVVTAASVLELMLVMQIAVVYISATRRLRQFDLPTVEIYNKRTELIYHLLLPAMTLGAIIGFVTTNNQVSLVWFYFFGSVAIYFFLFVNIRAYYEDKYKLEQQTHVIYDVVKVLLFFAVTDVIFNAASRYQFNFFVVAGMLFVTASILTLLILLRHPALGYLNMGLVLCSGLAIGYIGAALRNLLVSQNLVAAFYVTLVFYIANAILHHELERTLKLSIVLEYVLVATICFLIILLLT